MNKLLQSCIDYKIKRRTALDLAILITRAAREHATVDTIADEALQLLKDLAPEFKFNLS